MDQHVSSNSSVAFTITFLALIIMVILIHKKKMASNRRLPPGPRTLPIIGNMHQLIGAPPHQLLAELAKKHGPVMYLKLGQVVNVVVSSKQAAEEVLRTNDVMLAQKPVTPAVAIITYNSRSIGFAPYGDYWRQVRKICVLHLTSMKQVESFGSLREAEANALVRSVSLKEGAPVNLSKMLPSVMTNIISAATFGDSCTRVDAFAALIVRISKVLAGFTVADFFPSLGVLHRISGVRRKVTRLHREIDQVLDSVIAEYRAAKEAGRTKANEILGVLLDLQDQGDPQVSLSTESIKAILFDVFLGGIDTSATIIEWAMSESLKHPEVMKKLQSEVRQVLHNNKFSIDEPSLHQLKYMLAAIKETLRLHTAMLAREARESLTINGYEIPSKAVVLVNTWAIARDPQIWTDPEKFYPERFLESCVDYKGGHFEFTPFGAGRRMCPGIVFGMSSVELILANLLYHFDWKLPDGLKPECLDMDQLPGISAKRKTDLVLIATQHCP